MLSARISLHPFIPCRNQSWVKSPFPKIVKSAVSQCKTGVSRPAPLLRNILFEQRCRTILNPQAGDARALVVASNSR